jgi:hypothetical protein
MRHKPALCPIPEIALLCALFGILPLQPVSACSRAVYFGQEGQTVTGFREDLSELSGAGLAGGHGEGEKVISVGRLDHPADVL